MRVPVTFVQLYAHHVFGIPLPESADRFCRECGGPIQGAGVKKAYTSNWVDEGTIPFRGSNVVCPACDAATKGSNALSLLLPPKEKALVVWRDGTVPAPEKLQLAHKNSERERTREDDKAEESDVQGQEVQEVKESGIQVQEQGQEQEQEREQEQGVREDECQGESGCQDEKADGGECQNGRRETGVKMTIWDGVSLADTLDVVENLRLPLGVVIGEAGTMKNQKHFLRAVPLNWCCKGTVRVLFLPSFRFAQVGLDALRAACRDGARLDSAIFRREPN